MCQNHYIVAAEEEQPVCLPVSLICTRRGQLVDFGSFLLFFLKAHCNPFRKQSLTLFFFIIIPQQVFPNSDSGIQRQRYTGNNLSISLALSAACKSAIFQNCNEPCRIYFAAAHN